MNKINQELSEKVLNDRRKILKIETEQSNNFINHIMLKMFKEYEEKLHNVEDERKEM